MLPARSTMSLPMVRRPRATPRMPRYLRWRDGRPRWDPGPALRAKGYQGRDLKDAGGGWLKLWEACEAAETINKLVDDGNAQVAARPAARTMDALLDHIEALPKFRLDAPSEEGGRTRKTRRLARDTRAGYLGHFRIIREWAGKLPVAAITPSDCEVYYDEMVEARGHVMANRNIAALNMALNHARDKLQWLTHNPAKALDLVPEEGRQVMWSAEENIAFILCADWMGLEGIADAHIVALMTAQSRLDVLAMPELDIDGVDVFRLQRHKTGRPAYVPATRMLVERIRQMRQRKATRWPGVVYRHEIVNTQSGAPYPLEGSRFTEQHRAVRAVASGLQAAIDQVFPAGAPALDYSTAPFGFVPTIWNKRFQDLRDTAFTLLLEATGGDIAKVANITAHSLRTVQKVADKHYYVHHEGMSRSAGGQLETLMARIGYG